MRDIGKITFICSGNICRSPMAEVFAKALVEKLQLNAEVSSAGTLGIEDHPAATNAVQATAMLGIDLAAHRSQGMTPEYLESQDAIVVMAEEHARNIELRCPSVNDRVHRLWEYTEQEDRLDEIDDPVGGSIEQFIVCRDEIVECVTNWLKQYATDRI